MNEEFPFEKFFNMANQGKPSNNEALTPVFTKKPSMLTNDSLFDEILENLKLKLDFQQYVTYFEKNLSFDSIEGNQVIFKVPTPFIRSSIEKDFIEPFKSAIEDTLGHGFEIILKLSAPATPGEQTSFFQKSAPEKKKKTAADNTFTITHTPQDLKNQVDSAYIRHMNPQDSGIVIDPSKTFENYVVGPSNSLAFAAAKAVSQKPGKDGKYFSLYIYSNSGLGKSHLLHAIGNGIKQNYPHMAIKLTTGRDFMNSYVDSIKNNNIGYFRKNFTEKVDILIIDDIHELKDKTGTQNEFFHIFNELHRNGKQFIFTSDKSPKEIDGMEERIRTRFQWGLVVDIQKPDFETRLAILKKKALDLDLHVPEDVLILMAQNFQGSSSIRALEGNLIKLSAYVDIHKVELDVDIVKEQLKIQDTPEIDRAVGLEEVAKAVAQFFKIPLADLKSKSRSKDIAHARHIAMYLSRKIIRATQQETGYFFGGRDHTSVIHASQKIHEQIESDIELAKIVNQIEKSI